MLRLAQVVLTGALVCAAGACSGSESDGRTSSTGCPVNAPDVAPSKGECTVVDWDVVALDGATVTLVYYVNEPGCSLELDRIEEVEGSRDVTLNVIVGFAGDEGASCPTALSSRSAVVTLLEPLGARSLLGCRADGSFAPKGGYNAPEPRDSSLNCALNI